MAKYSVLKKFRDRETSEIHEIGSKFESSNKERIEKLQTGGWIGQEIKARGRSKSERVEAGEPHGAEADKSEKVQSQDSDTE
ncbi:hypothetical protein J25TS5_04040 [Paenibacillus faecis]|uniref:hypothetical protein n=1 Tax=Paenibacillus faecis TaxID=862114 RepID=UPI001B2EA04C|nr:hypothetical protein [Paenibacillus faecis]GIO83472.1 hypothetical protein J25TS5_04040 [Paenibacillus faecis]